MYAVALIPHWSKLMAIMLITWLSVQNCISIYSRFTVLPSPSVNEHAEWWNDIVWFLRLGHIIMYAFPPQWYMKLSIHTLSFRWTGSFSELPVAFTTYVRSDTRRRVWARTSHVVTGDWGSPSLNDWYIEVGVEPKMFRYVCCIFFTTLFPTWTWNHDPFENCLGPTGVQRYRPTTYNSCLLHISLSFLVEGEYHLQSHHWTWLCNTYHRSPVNPLPGNASWLHLHGQTEIMMECGPHFVIQWATWSWASKQEIKLWIGM
jgi:hypothetical protein